MSALFDFSSLLVVLLLLICTFAYVRAWTLKRGPDGELQSWLEASGKHRGGLRGCAWKAARVGERLSPYVAASCVIMVRRRPRPQPLARRIQGACAPATLLLRCSATPPSLNPSRRRCTSSSSGDPVGRV